MRVELERVRKRYGRLEALAGVDLDLPSGATVALIGPNGSGKTTLTRVIMGLCAHEGTLRLDGGVARAAAAPRIAYVPQVAPQMAAPVGELVRTIADVRGVAPARIAALAGELELDVAAIARRPFRGLSGGTKQKLLVALALAASPGLIVLDEPTASLDARARARFATLAARELAGATVILCSHRLDEVRTMVGRVVALAEGKVVHDGPAADFVAAHTTSVVEVQAAPAAADWLAARGFAPGAAGWWSRSVDRHAKLALVPELVAGLGAHLTDLVVRDLDRLVVPS